jgi:hypothetical protein
MLRLRQKLFIDKLLILIFWLLMSVLHPTAVTTNI